MQSKLSFKRVMFGCDPEFFFSKDGRVIGADEVLPEEGIVYKSEDLLGLGDSKVIIDGVQAELNPRPDSCRAVLGLEIANCFRQLSDHISKDKSICVDFKQTIKLDKDGMDTLSDKSKKFGCSPSRNAHNDGKMGSISVDPAVYQYRSAGGHIHLGASSDESEKYIKEVLLQPERLVKVMDVIVGNTCVLIDRDIGNIERRKVYGQAGEFRTPPHGVEYRTLSNFWLRSYQLMSLVMGLSRVSVLIVADNKDDELMKLVDMRKIAQAINTNDRRLALDNFKAIEKWFVEIMPENDEMFDIDKNNIHLFRHFVKKGLDYWFKEPPLEHWVALHDGHGVGFGEFLDTKVKEDFNSSSK